MATQFMDDFGMYGGTAAYMLNGVYAENGSCTLVADPDPLGSGQKVVKMETATGGKAVLRRVLSAAQTTVGVAMRGWLSILPTALGAGLQYASFRDLNNVEHGYVTVNPSGYILVYRNDAAGIVQIGISAGPVIVANAWQHVETKWVFDAAAGSVEVRVEGATVVNVAGLRTTTNIVGAVATCENVAVCHRSAGEIPVLDGYARDLIVWDGSGALNSDFFGTCSVVDMTPNADVALNWASTGANGFSVIDEAPPNDDTDYISAASGVAAYVAGLTDLPVDVTTVKALMTMVRSKKSDAGDGSLQAGLKSGATLGNGVNRPMTTAYTYWTDPFDTDPATAAQWTVPAANAVDLELNRTL